ncbi:MAG: GntR family transcriptional regulator [Thermoactinomycetaceae bacterium]|nr:GntR family transcriptional regulator [Bacillota bacterium]MBO2533340.1 GntR family transcriptional regulator [Thermoactinomycetaceae bacterium]
MVATASSCFRRIVSYIGSLLFVKRESRHNQRFAGTGPFPAPALYVVHPSAAGPRRVILGSADAGGGFVGKSLNPHSVIPLYHQLKEILKENIESGVWKPGDRIPSENELRKQYDVSRNTVIKALEELVQEGLLRREQGRGTFVSSPKISHSLTGFYSFSNVLRANGLEPKDVILVLERRIAKPSIARHLQLTGSQEVWVLKRLRCAGDEPIMLETSHLPQNRVPRIERADLENRSLYDYLEQKHGILVTRAKEIFEPVLIRDYESRYLRVPEGYPALLLDRIAYDSQGRPVEFCRSIVRGDRCRFYTELL